MSSCPPGGVSLWEVLLLLAASDTDGGGPAFLLAVRAPVYSTRGERVAATTVRSAGKKDKNLCEHERERERRAAAPVSASRHGRCEEGEGCGSSAFEVACQKQSLRNVVRSARVTSLRLAVLEVPSRFGDGEVAALALTVMRRVVSARAASDLSRRPSDLSGGGGGGQQLRSIRSSRTHTQKHVV